MVRHSESFPNRCSNGKHARLVKHFQFELAVIFCTASVQGYIKHNSEWKTSFTSQKSLKRVRIVINVTIWTFITSAVKLPKKRTYLCRDHFTRNGHFRVDLSWTQARVSSARATVPTRHKGCFKEKSLSGCTWICPIYENATNIASKLISSETSL